MKTQGYSQPSDQSPFQSKQQPSVRSYDMQGGEHTRRDMPQQQTWSYQMVKAATAVTAGGSMLFMSGLTQAATVVALTIATPILVIFSPVLVPAVIAVTLLVAGFLASGGFGVAAVTVFAWLYRYVTGGRPAGSEKLDAARTRLASKAREMKDRAEQFGQQHTGS